MSWEVLYGQEQRFPLHLSGAGLKPSVLEKSLRSLIMEGWPGVKSGKGARREAERNP